MALQLRRGTDAERQTIIPQTGELIYTIDTKLLYVGDGATTGGIIISEGNALRDLVGDTTPQLGGSLDLNSFNINGSGNLDIDGNATVFNTSTDTLASNTGTEILLNNNINLNSLSIVGPGAINVDGSIVSAAVNTDLLSSNVNASVQLADDLNLNNNNIIGTGNINIDGTITATGNINLGNSDTDNITAAGQFVSNIVPDVDNTYDIGTATLTWANGYFTNVSATSITSTDFAGDLTGDVLADDTSVFFDAATKSITTPTGTINTLTTESIESVSGVITIGNTTPTRLTLSYDGTSSVVQVNTLSTALNDAATQYRTSNGTLAAPTTLTNGDPIMSTLYEAYNGTSYELSSAIYATVDVTGTISATGAAGRLILNCANNTATGSVEATFNSFGEWGAPIIKPGTYADATARDSFVTNPVAGQIVYTTDVNRVQSYNGTDWVSVPTLNEVELVEVVADSTSFTLDINDGSQYHRVSNASAVTVTVPPNSSVAFPVGTNLTLIQAGAGQVTVAAGSGVTINSADSALSTRVQYSSATLTKVGTDEWDIVGDLA